MTQLEQQIADLLLEILQATSPVLSGNTKENIRVQVIEGGKLQIVIEPREYDVMEFIDNGIINLTSLDSYANSVNEEGGFHRHNKSETWVNRACLNACQTIAQQNHATVVNKLRIK